MQGVAQAMGQGAGEDEGVNRTAERRCHPQGSLRNLEICEYTPQLDSLARQQQGQSTTPGQCGPG